MNLQELARQAAEELMAQQDAWLIAQAEARGVTVQQLAATHALEIGPQHLERDEAGAMRLIQTLRLVPRSVL